MRILTTVSSLFAITLCASFWAPMQEDDAAQEKDPVEHAGKMFVDMCIACHAKPDLQFPTDRAWLNQVYDTA